MSCIGGPRLPTGASAPCRRVCIAIQRAPPHRRNFCADLFHAVRAGGPYFCVLEPAAAGASSARLEFRCTGVRHACRAPQGLHGLAGH